MSDHKSAITRKRFFVMTVVVGLFVVFLGVLLVVTIRSTRQKPKVEMLISQKLEQEDIEKSQGKNDTRESVASAKTNSLYLDVTEPKEKTILIKPTTYVRGRTAPFVEVFVNDISLKANRTGYFSTILQLTEGENSIFVVVNDLAGNYGERDVLATYNGMTPSPSTTRSNQPQIMKSAFVVIGTVKAKNSDGFIINSPTHGDQSVSTDKNTRFMNQDGALIDSVSITEGDVIRVKGMWDRSQRSVTRVVHIKDFSIKTKPVQSPYPTISVTAPSYTPTPTASL